MKHGFLKTAAITPEIKLADVIYNAREIARLVKEAERQGVRLAVFPELCLTGYTLGDLFLQQSLLESAKKGLYDLCDSTKDIEMLIAVGLPFAHSGVIYNCAAVIYKGEVLGFVPKVNIPNYSEFYEKRHFSKLNQTVQVNLFDKKVPMGNDLVFTCRNMPEFRLGVEICEDLWVPSPPSCKLAKMGATVIGNLSCSNEVIGKADYRRKLVGMQSAKLISGYVYADAGWGESTTDNVYSGHNIICENGTILEQSPLFSSGITISEIDLQKLDSERRRMQIYGDGYEAANEVLFEMSINETALTRKYSRNPFVPAEGDEQAARSREILDLQSTGLAFRLSHTKSKTAVVGLSGGLDSALALIVTVHAFDRLKKDHSDIIAITMPCFGTTERTKGNAWKMAQSYGVTIKEISIADAVRQHFKDIDQDENKHDVTFENAQARERTQVLMDIANKEKGIVIGTGDLSEMALGWSTYNGDHMSMYAVNSSIPKTLVRYLVEFEKNNSKGEVKKVLEDILKTPISPELLPPKKGEIAQKTEEIVGPYELHDFFLYYFMRFGFPPSKLLRIAILAFEGCYEKEEIKKWLVYFIKRFFAQQFKRSCTPDGVKVGSVSLSPRGDFRMPSDSNPDIWLKELEEE